MGDSYASRGSKRRHSNDDDDPTGKKKKNREAARKCREKKEMETKTLRAKNETLIKTNQDLNSRKEELERKLQECIAEIKRHRELGCKLPVSVALIIDSVDVSQDGIHQARQREQNDALMPQEIIPEAPQTVTGLFSGNQVPTVVQPNCGRSPSRSPPSQPHLCQTQTMAINPSPNTGEQQLSWGPLHQQTGGGQTSPGLSPAQTVPNIDTNTNTKLNGFPDINEEVQNAQNDPGLTLIDHSDPHINSYQRSELLPIPIPGRDILTSSLEFTPNLSFPTTTLSSAQTSQPNQLSICNPTTDNNSVPPKTNVQDPNSEVMYHALQTFNPDDWSVVSSDLLNHISNKSQENNCMEQNSQNFVLNDQGQCNTLEGNNLQLQPEQQSVSDMQIESSSTTTADIERQMLDLPRDEQINPEQYYIHPCEQSQHLAKTLLLIGTPQAYDNTITIYAPPHQFSQLDPQSQYDLSQVNGHSFSHGQGLELASYQPQVVNESPVESDQLPKTVLSLIQQDYSPSAQSESTKAVGGSQESEDYSENVKDLPSLSLTEDHTNIFEKKRRLQSLGFE